MNRCIAVRHAGCRIQGVGSWVSVGAGVTCVGQHSTQSDPQTLHTVRPPSHHWLCRAKERGGGCHMYWPDARSGILFRPVSGGWWRVEGEGWRVSSFRGSGFGCGV